MSELDDVILRIRATKDDSCDAEHWLGHTIGESWARETASWADLEYLHACEAEETGGSLMHALDWIHSGIAEGFSSKGTGSDTDAGGREKLFESERVCFGFYAGALGVYEQVRDRV